MSTTSTMSTLILTLPLTSGPTTPEYDYVLSRDGLHADSSGRASAALLPTQGTRGAEVVAVVPARALSWHRVSLPERLLRSLLGSRAEPNRVRAVLAGVLEEQLLDEPERLHFALFAAAPSADAEAQSAWVAVCERAWLQASLQALEAADRPVDRIVAECTPVLAGHARALLSDALEPAQMLLCTADGVSLLPLLPATLGLALAQSNLEVFAEPAAMEAAQASFGNQVVLQSRDQRLLQAAQSPWNLAQLELSASPRGRLQKRLAAGWQQLLQAPAWRPLRWGLLALLLVQLVALNALAWQQRRAQDAQRSAIEGVLQQTFPEVRLVIDAPLQMQRAVDDLARAHGGGADTDVGRVFAILSAQAPKSLSLSAIELGPKELRLSASGLDATQAQALIASLDARGLRAQWQDGQLLITPKESR